MPRKSKDSTIKHKEHDSGIRPTSQKHFKELEARLLAIGGNKVVYQHDPHVDRLVRRGRVFRTATRNDVGNAQDRHAATIALFYATHHAFSDDPCDFITGYALYRNGEWRPRVWLWEGGAVFDSGSDAVAYYGVPLTASKAAVFVLDQLLPFMETPQETSRREAA